MEFTASQLALLGATLLAAGLVAGAARGSARRGRRDRGRARALPRLQPARRGSHVRTHVAVATVARDGRGDRVPLGAQSPRARRGRHADPVGWVPAVVVGSALGTALVAALGGRALTGVFGTVALLVALHMAFGRDELADRRRAADRPGAPAARGRGRLRVGDDGAGGTWAADARFRCAGAVRGSSR